MKKLIATLYDGYRHHHESNKSLLQWIGVVGSIAFPLLYAARLTGKLPPRYDDLNFRLAAIVLCLFLALRRWWPERLRPFYLPYSYLTIFYCLAFLLPFTLLQNKAAANTIVNVVIGAVLIILLTDWRNTIVMLVTGYVMAVVVYWTVSPGAQLPAEFLYWWVPLSGILIAGGGLSKYAEKRAELERMRGLYSGLAGSIAHEMRNPLAQIRQVLDQIAAAVPAPQGGMPAVLSPEQAAAVTRSIAQGQQAVTRGLQAITVTLQQLNTNALDASTFTRLSAAQCVRKAVDEYAYDDESQRAKVSVQVRGDFTFKGEPTAFLMVLYNLIKNALYYLPVHPGATLSITVAREAGHRIVVRDTGPGIAPAVQARLFQEFHSAGKPEGTGLGLAFCRRVMRAFGGDITCRSTLGEFTEFTMTFPEVAPDGQEQRPDTASHLRSLLAGKRVLVVDDDPNLRKATVARLTAADCGADEAGSGAAALDMLARVAYDMVVMDIRMPGLDGLETTRLIRQGKVPGRERTPVIGFSAEPAGWEAGGRRAGMDGFLAKGCSDAEWTQAVVAVMTARPAQAERTGAAWKGTTVLLAEDSALNRSLTRTRLAELGMEVVEAAHGREVLQLVGAGVRPTVILMDMHMPGMDGIATTQALRALPAPAGKTPILALTAHVSAAQSQAAMAAGMDGVLTKPLDVPMLLGELARLLGGTPAASPSRQETPHDGGTPTLLNTERADEFRRLGILDELFPMCLADIRQLTQRLEACAASADRDGAYMALHSLLGASGEIGAQALHETAQGCYRALSQGEWPQPRDWPARIAGLASATEEAVLAAYALRPAAAAPASQTSSHSLRV
ncbi:ATP-binding response regulator [Ramlibacter tataouinensis]|nr:hybrid sensor histidine kinase/response regulator [Ramlibacter tataouinensis]